MDNQYFAVSFPTFIADNQCVSINELETLSLLIGVRLWGSHCTGKRLLVYCDNQATVAIVNTGRANNKFAQDCLRELHCWAAVYDFQVRAKFLASEDNRMADITSRMNRDTVKRHEFDILTKYLGVSERQVDDSLFQFANNW